MIRVYECHFTFFNFLGIVLVFIMIAFVLILKKRRFFSKTDHKRNKVFSYYYLIVLMGYEILLLLLFIGDYRTVYRPYKEKQYKVIEGYITDFDTNDKDERFQIDGITFEYQCNDPSLGYHRIKNEGGIYRGINSM